MNIKVPFTARAARRWPIARRAAVSAMSTGSPDRQKPENLRIAMNKWLHPGVAPPADASGRAANLIPALLPASKSYSVIREPGKKE